jgi:transglutaminase-like putative cysteine protease
MGPSGRKRTGLFAGLLALLVIPGPALEAAGAGRRFAVGPAPDWLADPGRPASGEAVAAGSTGTRYLLFDQQLLVGRDERELYMRTVWRAETTAGVQDASEIAIPFDPTYERLVLHEACILRGGRKVWTFSPADVRVIESEENLDARIYNGELTATIFLRDLRVGDTVDYAYSLVGANPVLGGRFDAVLWLGYSRPVDLVRRRLVWRKAAPPRFRLCGGAPEPVVETGPQGAVYTWQTRGLRLPVPEDQTPSWFLPYPRVEVSDFEGWSDVARRSRELFSVLDAPAPAIDALVHGWRLADAPLDARVDRAVRFVQDEVRYLGLEMGPSSHRPHPPAKTLARRFGDCKDKSALLVAILRRLGVRAWPALVSTRARQALDDRLPSLFAFDHVIVAIRVDDALLFVDATASEQGGPVRTRRPPPYARALLLDGEANGLTEIPEPVAEVPSTEVEETFAVASWASPARLDVVTTYRGDDADEARQGQARATRAETSRRYRDFYSQEHGTVRALGLPKVEDDRDRNVVVVREAYEMPAPWKQGSHDFRAWLVDEWLQKPRTLERTAPLRIPHPGHVKQVLTLKLPGPPDLEPLRETVRSPAFSMDASWTVRGNEARLEYTYRTLRGSLPPADVAGHVDSVDRAAGLVVCRLPDRPRPGAARPVFASPGGSPDLPDAAGLGALALVALGILGVRAGLSSWRVRCRRARFRGLTVARPGQEPLTAIRVVDDSHIARAGFGGACRCNVSWREVDRATVTYDGRPMTVVTRRCDRCGGETASYFEVGSVAP